MICGIKVILCALVILPWGRSDQAVNADSLIIQDFEKRVAAYVQLHKNAESALPPLKATATPGKIEHYEHALARAIVQMRKGAAQGDIFTPQIAGEMRRLLGLATASPADRTRVERSLKNAEPVNLKLQINHRYPASIPLQSTPPSLLMNLPPLPPELQYRLAGRDLVLLDAKANLVVDLTGIESL